jgi:hypothetical protein
MLQKVSGLFMMTMPMRRRVGGFWKVHREERAEAALFS